jgi:NTP pyrophosphatase (non-canonical NTP hydrolase)
MSTAHQELVKTLAKPGANILMDLTPAKCHLLHMVIGISGESGEVLDAVKKFIIYNRPLDLKNVIEELGDIEFYMEGLRSGLGISREQTLEANIDKLRERYEVLQYSDRAAQERADKQLELFH